MRVRQICEKFPKKLFAVVYEPEVDTTSGDNVLEEAAEQDELERGFRTLKNAIFLREFFMEYRRDLQKREPNMSVNDAIRYTINEAQYFHDELIKLLKYGTVQDLTQLFKPLDNRELKDQPYELQMMKAKRPRSWLRLYALRYGDSYIITGFAIKITDDMTRPHLKKELEKLRRVQKFLEVEQNEAAFVYLEV
jgi:hypothetical protein